MKKHIGKLVNTDQRVVVVFMQIPERTDHALVVSIDNLHPRLEQALLEIVDSKEGQHDAVLANVLGRRVLPDTNENVLKALHERQLLRAVHVDQVVMLPQPNMPFPLRGILQSMGRTVPGEVQPEAAQAERFNPHANNSAALDDETKVMIARNLLIDADMLAAEANNKREKAYTYAPSLRPAPASVTINSTGTLNVSAEKIAVKETAPKAKRPRAPRKTTSA